MLKLDINSKQVTNRLACTPKYNSSNHSSNSSFNNNSLYSDRVPSMLIPQSLVWSPSSRKDSRCVSWPNNNSNDNNNYNNIILCSKPKTQLDNSNNNMTVWARCRM